MTRGSGSFLFSKVKFQPNLEIGKPQPHHAAPLCPGLSRHTVPSGRASEAWRSDEAAPNCIQAPTAGRSGSLISRLGTKGCEGGRT